MVFEIVKTNRASTCENCGAAISKGKPKLRFEKWKYSASHVSKSVCTSCLKKLIAEFYAEVIAAELEQYHAETIHILDIGDEMQYLLKDSISLVIECLERKEIEVIR